MSKITNIIIDEAKDYPEVAEFFTYALNHFGFRNITKEEFTEALESLDNKNDFWEWISEAQYDGEIIDNDREKCIETKSFGDRIGTCKIDGKPYIISFSSCWQDSPYFNLSTTMDWPQWNFNLCEKEIFNEKNPANGFVNLTRKPQQLHGFILTNKNIEDFVKFIRDAFPEINVIHDRELWNKYDGYNTKSHTRVKIEFEATDDKDLSFLPGHRFCSYEFRVGDFHYISQNSEGQPFITWLTKEEIDKDYDIQH